MIAIPSSYKCVVISSTGHGAMHEGSVPTATLIVLG